MRAAFGKPESALCMEEPTRWVNPPQNQAMYVAEAAGLFFFFFFKLLTYKRKSFCLSFLFLLHLD